MLRRGSGQLVFVASLGGRTPIPNEAAYNAAKYALCGFAEAACLDLSGTGLEVKLVLPGPIDTDILGSTRQRSEPRATARRSGAQSTTIATGATGAKRLVTSTGELLGVGCIAELEPVD